MKRRILQKHILNLICALCLVFECIGQIGGLSNFEFLRQSPNARATALGGSFISVSDGDIAAAWQNPGILDSTYSKRYAVNHNFHFAGISNGLFSAGHYLTSRKLSLIGGVQYVNYGTFDATNEIGVIDGTFKAREVAIGVGAAKQMNERIRLGALLKFANSSLESYSASGIVLDVGIYYSKPNANSSWGIVLKNMGVQLSTFTDEEKSIPFDLQLAYSTRLKHLPFRFTIVGHRLDQWDIRYDDPDRQQEVDLLGQMQTTSAFSKSIDNLFRHLIFNGEFLLGKKEVIRLRIGYNHLLKKELSVTSFRSFGGFSFGFGIKVKKFRFDFGRGNYHLAGGVNHIGLSIDLNQYKKKI